MNKNLTYPEVKSKTPTPKKLVVLLHGVGSDGHDLIGLVPYLKDDLPDCYFISPHGVEAYDMAPYGRQWFSLQDRTPHKIRALLKNNIVLLAEIIKQKQVELGLTNKDTIIIGFSQGTMMGLYLTLTQDEPFLCTIGFSGLLIIPNKCINISTPICLIHGELDEVVRIDAMDDAAKYLSEHQVPHSSHRIPRLAHSIDAKGLEFAINFIKKQ